MQTTSNLFSTLIILISIGMLRGSGQIDHEAKFPVDLSDSSAEEIAVIYEQFKGKEIIFEIDDMFKVNLKTVDDVSQIEFFWMLEELFRLNGIELIEETGKPIRLVRVSDGEFYDSKDDSVESRLEKTLSDLQLNNENVEEFELMNQKPSQALELAQAFTGKTILRGPGLPENIRINYESSAPMSQADAFLILESLLREKGIILLDTGSDCIAALAVK
ncbi:hypothetical protein [Rubellicoccus peritrichatus]|uniref:Uncharacterized protein n=1 Tax=Rubellicoccus peritrichatus TaxID=3080537 RepID=A0AAQ3QVE4_9BACT|nr:hypothetical protein [Puniceicoccus sp. CR14]WOO43366.1 hypothetical protein RZN69_09725 [Puniceicoccus sp. CR14]